MVVSESSRRSRLTWRNFHRNEQESSSAWKGRPVRTMVLPQFGKPGRPPNTMARKQSGALVGTSTISKVPPITIALQSQADIRFHLTRPAARANSIFLTAKIQPIKTAKNDDAAIVPFCASWLCPRARQREAKKRATMRMRLFHKHAETKRKQRVSQWGSSHNIELRLHLEKSRQKETQ